MSKKYLVTGAAGFIASQVSKQLLDQGDHVVGVDNLNNYYDIRLKNWRLDQLKVHTNAHNLFFANLDIEDQAKLANLFLEEGPFDAVLNLAARAGVRYSMENPHVYFSTNAEGTLNLLECMRAHGCNKLVLASTSSLYAGQKMPFTEDLAVNEPLSPYAASKASSDRPSTRSKRQISTLALFITLFSGLESIILFKRVSFCGTPLLSLFRIESLKIL